MLANSQISATVRKKVICNENGRRRNGNVFGPLSQVTVTSYGIISRLLLGYTT